MFLRFAIERPAMPSENDPPILEYAGPSPRHGHSFRDLRLIAIGILVLLFFILMLLPPRNGSHPASPRLISASNLRQIGQAILLYSNDESRIYPDNFRTLLLHGDITSQQFVSPLSSDTPAAGPTTQAIADQLTAGGHLSYIYLGRGLTIQTATANTVVAYENLSIAGTGANVLFGDGHVEWDDAKFIKQIINKSASGKFPVTMP
jgi:prepilin-type processing-associated H-X9-DG protein